MILSLFRKTPSREPVYAVYAAIVAQSRRPVFYADWGVPDTVTGRFDMISLHLALLFRRLRPESGEARAFNQLLFDLFFQDMDRSLREMGAGDLAVPKKIRKMGALFYGLLKSVAEALDAGDRAALEAALARNVFEGVPAGRPAELAAYLEAESQRLAGIPAAAILGGRMEAETAA
jgi:cytochrome b pre-mRNA-processing protein 3